MKPKHNKYQQILVMVTGFLVLYFIFHLNGFLYAALAVGLLASVSSFLADKIVWLWLKLAEGLGYVNSRILLSVIYFFILLPISLLYRLFNKNTIQMKKSGVSSYFKSRDHQYSAADLEKPW